MATKNRLNRPELFNAQDAAEIDGHITRLDDWMREADRAQACGIDCSALRSMRDDLSAQLKAIKAHYMGK